MSSKNKIEKDYKDFEACVEQLAEEELKIIDKKTREIKKQAEKVGDAVEADLAQAAEKKG